MENEQNNYYPFGLQHAGYNKDVKEVDFAEYLGYTNEELQNISEDDLLSVVPVIKNKYRYKYQGQERQDELDLNWDSFKWRNYDYAIGRFMSVDPFAEKFAGSSPYAFVANNPIIYFDPDGRDIYRYDKRTGELVLHQETDDDFDIIGKFKKKKGEYILKIDKDGNAKTHVNNMAKGILHDGINFKEENNTIVVNGTNEDGSKQPTTQQVEDFIRQGSRALGKEVSGYGLGSQSSDRIENILIWKTKDNSFGNAKDVAFNKDDAVIGRYLNVKSYLGSKSNLRNNRYAKYHYHTHPNVKINRTGGIDTPSEPDKIHAATAKLPHYILNVNGKFKYNQNGSEK